MFGCGEVSPQPHHRLTQMALLLGGEACRTLHADPDRPAPLAQRAALRRQVEADLPFVLRVALARQRAHRLQTFQQRRQRARIEEELFAELADGLVRLLIECDQRDILRIGDPSSSSRGL
jgi:hypothetical protein